VKAFLRWAAIFRREGRTLYAGGREVVETTKREGLSFEGRAGAILFLGLHGLSFLQSPAPLPAAFDLGPAFERLAAEAALSTFIFHVVVALAAAAAGAFLGVFIRSAWDLAEALAPIPRRRAWRRRYRWGTTISLLLFLHGGFLLGAFRAQPAAFQAAFFDHGGLWRFVQTGFTDGFLVPFGLLWRAGAALVLLLGVLQMGWRFSRWFLSFPLPTRIASLVLGTGTVIFLMGIWGVFRFHAPRNVGPNLVVLIAEGLRSDDLMDPALTPALNALLHRSRAFTACVPPVAQRESALMTFLTGRSPLTHGLRHAFPAGSDVQLGAESLPGRLRRAGSTVAVAADAGGDLFARLSPSFDRTRATLLDVRGMIHRDILRRSVHLLPYLRISWLGGQPWARRLLPALRAVPEMADPLMLAAEGKALLQQLRFEDRFCLILHFSGLGMPAAISSSEARRALSHDRNGSAKTARSWRYRVPEQALFRRFGAVSPSEAVRAQALVRANLQVFDRAVASVLENVEESGLTDATWVALWSPFADQRGEDGRLGRGASLSGRSVYEAPFLLAGPFGRTPPRTISVPVSAEDIAPTLLAAAGVPVSEEMEGVSLLGEDAFSAREVYAETDLWYDPEEASAVGGLPYGTPSTWLEEDPETPGRLRVDPAREDALLAFKHRLLQWGPERLIYRPARDKVHYALYNVAQDPEGRSDLAGSRVGAERIKDLREIFFQSLQRESGWRPQNDFWIPEAFLRESE
jgi:hypothetical protein